MSDSPAESTSSPVEPPARKRPKPGERRIQILQALATMLEQPGSERITTAALAARLGVSEAALYRHFANKQDLPKALPVAKVSEELGLAALRARAWHIQGCCATTGDGLLAALRLAAFVHGHHSPLATLAGNVMETYPQVLVNVRVADRHPHAAAELADEIAAAEQSLGDEGRVLVRASGTEPLIRVMVEAPTAATAQSIADELAFHVQRRFG